MAGTDYPVFDCHLHIIDPRFPLTSNQGYLPEAFTAGDYLNRTATYNRCGGAVVSGSFQGFDQHYLVDALATLGEGFVGVANLPLDATDGEILRLDAAGVRAVRFNLYRGASAARAQLDTMARRVHELVGWHLELYAQSDQLDDLASMLCRLPAVSIDHLGLSKAGMPILLKLVESGLRVKATGFGRLDFDIALALKDIDQANPAALMFGTDLPSTRATRPYRESDLTLLVDVLGDTAPRALADNALEFYRLRRA